MKRRVTSIHLCALAAAVALGGCQHFVAKPLAPEELASNLESRSLVDPGLRDFVETSVGQPVGDWPPARWDLDALTLAALYFRSDLAVARSDFLTSRAGVETAAARPNPTLTVAPEYVSNAQAAVSPWIALAQLDWPIETAGKRRHRIAQAEALAEGMRRRFDDAAWRVRGELNVALVALATADTRASHLARESQLQNELTELLGAQRDAGAIPNTALALQRMAALQVDHEWGDARSQRQQAATRVAAAIGLPIRALEGVELDTTLDLPADARALDSVEARRRALTSRADVLAALSDYAASEASLQLELARQYPNVHIGQGYQFDQGSNKWGLGVGIELPILNRNEGPIAEAESRREQAATRFEGVQSQVIAEVERASADLDSALEQLARSEAAAQERAEFGARSRNLFEAGARDRASMVAAQLEVERGERLWDEDRARALDAHARLERAIQPPLEWMPAATRVLAEVAPK